MELKTRIKAEEGKQELHIYREFDLPVELLYKAYVEPQIVEQWMGTKVIELENKRHGSWHFETTDPKGNKYGFHGVIHDIVANRSISRTFEMDSADFGPQLEFFSFDALSPQTSLLTMQVVYRSVDIRDQILKLPFAQGINMAHNRLQEVMNSIKITQ